MSIVDRDLPSAFSAITGRQPRGSWWSDTESHLIYATMNTVGEDPKIMRIRLLDGKWTLVHRRLWAAVVRVAGNRASWQRRGLSPAARQLLRAVERKGHFDLDDPLQWRGPSLRTAGEAARELERRLLVISTEVHTQSGWHTRSLESWRSWSRRKRISPARIGAAEARTRIDKALQLLAADSGGSHRLPWVKSPRRTRASKP